MKTLFVEGIIIVLDLDRFEEYTIKYGLDQYKPNTITGMLTSLVENFIRKWRAVVVYGLDYERGTEETIIEIPYGFEQIDEIVKDLKAIKDEINKAGALITIVVVKDYVLGRKARNRKEAYHGTPGRRRAIRVLRKAKRAGGNKLVVLI
ncbi:hypothetical protein [Staphylothermus hellenicus]|uniref:GGDEF domain-containing protein n=1 Tax=Staphylothermus hellenicus (strain DSM 12710 / JCM 10830 / BK20S6-10-b1 / P8) TaxID=591019 RepID=D7D8Y2_STAHD|nr:hypothetical protein [Staphylothermus hellenicus]ADI32228.1 hypothetical protein Shell_1126 [Staphylothermus hellenicus DSM 12710]